VYLEKKKKERIISFSSKKTERFSKNVMKQLKNKNVLVDEREELQRQSKLLVASLKKKHTMEKNTRLMDNCMTSFCNPGCVGTLLAKGKKFPLLSASRIIPRE
jgi:Zn-dependent oligopeptidase